MAVLERVRQVVLRPKRYLIIATTAFALSAVLAQAPLYKQIARWIQDGVHGLTAQRVRFEDVLIIDIDESAMATLQDSVGSWPYPRSVYVGVVDWLVAAGARAVVFDMLLIEPREGDGEFARALSRHNNVWLATRGQEFSLLRGPEYFALLKVHAWSVPEKVPVTEWQDMLLPTPQFGERAGVGVISVNPDEDGVLRRIAPFHRAHGVVLPAMSIAAMFPPGEPAAVAMQDNTLVVGRHRWPLADDGRISLQIPRNKDFLRVVSFADAMAVARAERRVDVGEIRGRTVFIGSSAAILGDYARLPIHGRTAGLGILALTHSALANGLVLKPPRIALNVALVLLAAALPLLYTNRRVFSEFMITLWAMTGIGGALTVHVAAFGWFAQMSDVAFAILLGLIVWLVQLAMRFRTLYDERQRLWMEKLAADEANELKSRFLAHMTHELRTPLTAILGYNKLLAEPESSSGERLQHVRVVARNGQHLMSLINNLLDQAKIEAGQMSVDREPVVIRELLEECGDTLASLSAQKDLELRVDCADAVPLVLSVDPLRLTQILLNIAGNAIKFTEFGEVRVDVRWVDSTLQISIIDTGPGMSKQALARIFDAFAQADSTVVREHGGTGLGLTISRNLAQQMGGDIEVESTLGRGTVFTVSIEAPGAQPLAATAPGREALSMRFQGTVLLADDTADIRELVSLHLRRLGLTVSTAENGEQAVALARRDSPDLVLMDVEMPKLGGIEATQALREHGFSAPVLALTAHRDAAHLHRLVESGCNGVVHKPVTREELAAAMREYLPLAQVSGRAERMDKEDGHG